MSLALGLHHHQVLHDLELGYVRLHRQRLGHVAPPPLLRLLCFRIAEIKEDFSYSPTRNNSKANTMTNGLKTKAGCWVHFGQLVWP